MGSLRSPADDLFARVAQLCSPSSGSSPGSFSPSLYDTAWLAMVQKPLDSGSWLFPKSFEYVLEQQMPSGAWPAYATVADGILNTAAGLLALKRHLKGSPPDQDLSCRALKATSALDGMLQNWDVLSNDQVGFELLITKVLSLLTELGVEFVFPGSVQLQQLYDSKLGKLPASSVEKRPSTLYHSLEALIGHINFDEARKWRQEDGSMLGSPSSTAAYLMNCAEWDDEAEAYLRAVVEHGTGANDGGVPSAWPTTIFDVTWVRKHFPPPPLFFFLVSLPNYTSVVAMEPLTLSQKITTALSKSTSQFAPADKRSVAEFLEGCLSFQEGIVGFGKTIHDVYPQVVIHLTNHKPSSRSQVCPPGCR